MTRNSPSFWKYIGYTGRIGYTARSARPLSHVSRPPRQLRASFTLKTRKNKPVLHPITKETLVTFDH